ncbi:MAG: amino acid ABC transporter substrate-binding protein [Rickettsia sp.]|nr:amino acid ABC transporter substrate-binding protein [Rickettsia sp.]
MKFLFLTILHFLFFITTSCDQPQNMDDKKKLVIATSSDNPPYEYIKEGEIIGFDIDIIHEIFKNTQYKIEIKNMDFHALIPSLVSKRVDLVIAGLSINQERAKIVDFSIPYTQANPVLIFKKELHQDFSLEKIQDQTIAVQIGTVFVEMGKILSEKYNSNLFQVENSLFSIQDLLIDRMDYIILEKFQAQRFTEIYPELTFYQLENFESSSFAIAMPKNCPMKDEIDNAILKIKKSGTIDKLYEKWNIY